MAKGVKTGGRQKGTLNKDSQDLFAICEKHKVNVFEGMVMLAAAEEDPFIKFERLKELAPYLYSKRRDLSIAIDPEKNVMRVVFEDYTKK